MVALAFIAGAIFGGTAGILAMAIIVSGKMQDKEQQRHYTQD